MNAKFKFVTISPLVCAAVLILTSTAQAGTLPGFRRFDTASSRANPNRGATTNRGGMDDPMNHDMGEDRGMNRPGDDNDRHARRHHRGHH